MTERDLEEAATVPPARTGVGRGGAGGRGGAAAFQQKLQEFYKAEGVVALFNRGSESDVSTGGAPAWGQHADGDPHRQRPARPDPAPAFPP